MILIVGSEGSMGKRYQAILDYLEEPYEAFDVKKNDLPQKFLNEYKGFIIATPTDTHYQLVKHYAVAEKPILCEKPLSRNVEEVKAMYFICKNLNAPLTMMFQYSILPSIRLGIQGKTTSYNFFRHGNDGLVWDCLQIIGLATGEIELREDCPFWHCVINGAPAGIEYMDKAYVLFVKEWLKNPRFQDESLVMHAHEKTRMLANEFSSNSDSSA